MKKSFFAAALLFFCAMLGAEPLTEKNFSKEPGFTWSGGALRCSVPAWPNDGEFFKKVVRTDLPPPPAGEKVEFSAEVRWIDAPAEATPLRGYIQFALFKNDGKTDWHGIHVTPAHKEWTKVSRIIEVPEHLKLFRLAIGFEKACGNFEIRNINVKALGRALNLARYANRTIRDEVPGDGKGGWTDQGPASDGRVFESFFRQTMIGGAPFHIPMGNPDAKNILVMRSGRNPQGPPEVEIPVEPMRADYLYLLHTLSYAGENGASAGRIIVKHESGAETELPVVAGRDLGDWYDGKPVTGGSDAVQATVRGVRYVLYLTRYTLPRTDKKVVSVRFVFDGGDQVWIICGATLSKEKFELAAAPEKVSLTITANEEWQVPLRKSNFHCRQPGSILDVREYSHFEPITEENRVELRDGRFYRRNDPGRPVRFFCAMGEIHLGFPLNLETEEKIGTWIEDMKLHGYNMLQIYSSAVMKSMEETGEFNPRALELYDYMFDLCRKNGIYVDFILLPRRSGFFPYKEQWGNAPWPFGDEEPNVSFGVYFSQKHRDNWEQGVTRLLNHRNRYSNIAWKDDPAILLYGGDNEQEFCFNYRDMPPRDRETVIGPYRDFLKNRYRTIDAYNARWGTKFGSFDDIPCFSVKEKNSDVNDFLYEKSVELLRWEKSVLRKIGAGGYFGETMNFVKTLTYHFIRREFDFVGMHIYHDHPLGNREGRGGYNRQTSALETGNQFFRTLAGTRIYGKPLICTEYDQPFWNRYRYERSFAVGAYAAFNGLDGLCVWREPVKRIDITKDSPKPWLTSAMKSFTQSVDPLSDASQLLTFFMFMRGDVRTTDRFVRIVADRPSVFATDPLAAPAPEQTALSLLTGYCQENVDDPKSVTPASANELLIPSLGGGKMRVESWFTEAVGATRNISRSVAMLKEKGFLSADNRSNGGNLYENATKELYLDIDKAYMTVDTPRLQGMCGRTGATAKLADFEVVSHDRDGNLTLAAADGMKPIREADRLLLVRITNALNSGMEFTDKDMCQLEKLGQSPALLQNSRFTVRIRNRRADELALYPLTLEGVPAGVAVAPESVAEGVATFTVDTAEAGNTVYFELR